MGIDIRDYHSKSMDQFLEQKFDYVITVCDRAREVCPTFLGKPDQIHWSIADPAGESEKEKDMYPAFQKTAIELKTRITYFLLVINRR